MGADTSTTSPVRKPLKAALVLGAMGPGLLTALAGMDAGGVATSALEMEQNAGRTRWDFATAEKKLAGIMEDIHGACVETAEFYGKPGDYVLGANAAGFTRVADVMIAHGIV